jgi:hypothetical protein
MKTIFKKFVPHLIAIAIFLAVACIYFAPSVFQGKTLQQQDMQQVTGMEEELKEYYNNESGKSAWTGSMFSGMPSYHIAVYGNPPNYLSYIEKPITSIDYFGASMILAALISFYILLCVMGVKRWLAVAGAIAYALASYNFIIIAVGHITKMYAIAYMPLTLAGMFLLFRNKLLGGALLSLLGIAFSLMSSHIQITYYLAVCCFVIFLGFTVDSFIRKEIRLWTKVFSLLIIAAALSVIPSLSGIYANYEVGMESLRGPSELTPNAEDAAKPVSSGLDIDYAFAWSYGKSELLTLMIPNVYGGSSNEKINKKDDFYKILNKYGVRDKQDANGRSLGFKEFPAYWGGKPFTSGPNYLGAVVCFLFVFGMFVIKNPLKWWIFGAAALFMLMALGKNCHLLNDFLFYNLPMYNKFRTPEMSLVIPGLLFPLIGFWGLKQIIDGENDSKKLNKSLIWALSITGGICLLLWLLPSSFFNFQSPSDAQYGLPDPLLDALENHRKTMLSSDAFRSLVLILLSSALVFYYLICKNKKTGTSVLGIGLIVLITFDLWGVDQRYLNKSSFSKKALADSHQKTLPDEFIMQDKTLSYRVLNLSTNTFNESTTSFFHKSIGGYHPAKLRRYQELIDHRISGEISLLRSTVNSAFQRGISPDSLQNALQDIFLQTPTLNMLNAKYVILHQELPPLINPFADGNAWFVEAAQFVPDADHEIEALNNSDPLKTAVIDEKFADSVSKSMLQPSEDEEYIMLTEYKPNILKYESNTFSEKIAVFSEIYYPHGWKVFIDGQPSDYYRADWTLRAMNVPVGKHSIEFRFEPDTYFALVKAGSITSLVFLFGFISAIIYFIIKRTKKVNKSL